MNAAFLCILDLLTQWRPFSQLAVLFSLTEQKHLFWKERGILTPVDNLPMNLWWNQNQSCSIFLEKAEWKTLWSGLSNNAQQSSKCDTDKRSVVLHTCRWNQCRYFAISSIWKPRRSGMLEDKEMGQKVKETSDVDARARRTCTLCPLEKASDTRHNGHGWCAGEYGMMTQIFLFVALTCCSERLPSVIMSGRTCSRGCRA